MKVIIFFHKLIFCFNLNIILETKWLTLETKQLNSLFSVWSLPVDVEAEIGCFKEVANAFF